MIWGMLEGGVTLHGTSVEERERGFEGRVTLYMEFNDVWHRG